jgi:putative ABC transport system ATP-binding protein
VSDTIIQFSNIRFSYDNGRTLVLNIPQWQINRGQHTFIVGESGSGKSTLLNLLSGINTPDSGELVVLEQSLTSMSARKLDNYRATKVGVIFQQLNLIPYISVLDNILLAVYFGGKKEGGNIQSRIEVLASQLNLPTSILAKQASELSVGQQQRVAIIRAMINEPAILIADEPTSALDENSKSAFLSVLFELVNATNCTLLFVSHDKSLMGQFESVVEMSELNQVRSQQVENNTDNRIKSGV